MNIIVQSFVLKELNKLKNITSVFEDARAVVGNSIIII